MPALTIPEIKALPAKRALIGFGDRLYLNVSTNGCKSWSYIWRDQTQQIVLKKGKNKGKKVGLVRTFGLGSFDAGVMPKEARGLANAVAVKVRMGIDPIKEREETAKLLSSVTFRDCLQKLIKSRSKTDWKQNPDKKRTTGDLYEAQMEFHVKALLDMPVRNITDEVAVAAMQPVFDKSVKTYNTLLGMCFSVMTAAGKHHPGPNPFRDELMLNEVGARKGNNVKVKSVASLPYEKAPALFARLAKQPGLTARCLQTVMLTACRTDEARCMRWSEIDWANKVWNIPENRMKAGEAHAIPLSDAMMAILTEIRAKSSGDTEFVFSFTGTTALAKDAMDKKLCGSKDKGGFGLRGEATVHGFRTTFTTWAEEQRVNGTPRWTAKSIAQSIAHAHGTKADRAYFRSPAFIERREQMDDYAAFLTAQPVVAAEDGNVVSFAKAA